MSLNWDTCTLDIRNFVQHILNEVEDILNDNLIGFYLHGSLAMGGFNTQSSDIDVLVITKNQLSVETKRSLARVFLKLSNHPYPVEVSFLHEEQMKEWNHPYPFDFHYGEDWRQRYEDEFTQGTNFYINEELQRDADLAAHITIINHRGICLKGKPIKDVFPEISRSDYTFSIMGDFQDCLKDIEKTPIYCTLNLIRVYWYVKEGSISSKLEAGKWGQSNLPNEFNSTLQKVLDGYTNNAVHIFTTNELMRLSKYVDREVDELLQ